MVFLNINIGSEPSLISQTSGSKHVAVSNDSVSPETNRDRNKNTNKSFSDINNSENKPPGDLDVKATYPLMPIISDSAEFIPKEIVRTPSYLRIASAVSGYGHYSRYSAYKGIEKRSPYSSTLSLRSSRSDLATPLSPVDMPIGKIPNYQPPTNYPPIRTNVLSPKSDNTFILDPPSEALNGAKNENTFRNLVNGDVTDSVNVVSVVNGENGHITPIAENGDSSESPESQTNGEITPCAENGHAVLVENFVTTGDNFKDADYFLQVTDDEETRLLLLCSKCEMEIAGIELSEEVGGKVRAAIGKGNLLINQKFKQFRELCNQHKYPEEGAKPTKWEDLQGFWEMVKLQVDDVEEMFAELDLMRQNGWREIKLQSRRSSASSRSSPKSGSLSVSNTSTPSHTPGSRRKAKLKDTPESSPERTQKAKMAAKVREDNRKKLLAEKRAAMKQKKEQNNEAVEIFVADNGSKSNSGGEGSSNSAEGSEV